MSFLSTLGNKNNENKNNGNIKNVKQSAIDHKLDIDNIQIDFFDDDDDDEGQYKIGHSYVKIPGDEFNHLTFKDNTDLNYLNRYIINQNLIDDYYNRICINDAKEQHFVLKYKQNEYYTKGIIGISKFKIDTTEHILNNNVDGSTLLRENFDKSRFLDISKHIFRILIILYPQIIRNYALTKNKEVDGNLLTNKEVSIIIEAFKKRLFLSKNEYNINELIDDFSAPFVLIFLNFMEKNIECLNNNKNDESGKKFLEEILLENKIKNKVNKIWNVGEIENENISLKFIKKFYNINLK